MKNESEGSSNSVNRPSLQSTGSLKLEMPVREIDDHDHHFYQPKIEDHANILNFDSKRNHLLDYNIPNSDQFFNFSSNHDVYLEQPEQQYHDHQDNLTSWIDDHNDFNVHDINSDRLNMFQQSSNPANLSSLGHTPLAASKDSNEGSMEGGKTKIVASGSTVTPQSRHARRLYVGGLTSSNCNEEMIKNFLNSVICNALGDPPESTYILSIYVNQQKCFAFIELNSIELTTACLELDGILFQNSPLKILRANEYKPELLPPPSFPPIKLNLTGLLFGPSSSASNSSSQGTSSPQFGSIDPQMDQLIKYCSVNTVQRGSIVIIGFPYDDPLRRGVSGVIPISNVGKNRGMAMAPRSIRTALRKFQSGSLINPEYGIDLSQLRIFDIGDIQGGLSNQDAFKSLADIIAEIVQRGATPVVIGGSSEIAANIAAGLMLVYTQHIGMINISPSVDATVLDDSRFFMPRPNYGAKLSCEGRYVHFAAHGSCTTIDQLRLATERGARILWYNKDLRNRQHFQDPNYPQLSNAKQDIGQLFKQTLHQLSNENLPPQSLPRPICVSFSMSALSSAHFPGHSQLRSTGLTAEDAMDIALILGKEKNVMVISINDFNVEVEENRSSRLTVDFLYNFFVGFASRFPSSTYSPRQATGAISSKPTRVSHQALLPTGQHQVRTANNKVGLPTQPFPSGTPHHFPGSYSPYPLPDGGIIPPGLNSGTTSRTSISNYSGYGYPDRSLASSVSSQESTFGAYSSRGSPVSNQVFPQYASSPGGTVHPSGFEGHHIIPSHRDSRPGSKGESPTGYTGADRHPYPPNNSLPPYY